MRNGVLLQNGRNRRPELAVTLRPCTLTDAKQLFDWRNHPQIVSLSTFRETVEWDSHQSWLKRCLSRPGNYRIFMIVDEETDIGMVRFERINENVARVSVYLSPSRAGQGLGVSAIKTGTRRIFSLWPELRRIDAYVREENLRGARAFKKAGYLVTQGSLLSGHLLMVRERHS